LYDTDLDSEQIARKAMQIAADIDIYTNGNCILESLDIDEADDDTAVDKTD
jgi:ATP-dependent HslUV protease subunit HslV